MEGFIMFLDHELEPQERWVVGAEAPTGESFVDYPSQEMWNQLELGMWYIMGQTQIPPQPEPEQ